MSIKKQCAFLFVILTVVAGLSENSTIQKKYITELIGERLEQEISVSSHKVFVLSSQKKFISPFIKGFYSILSQYECLYEKHFFRGDFHVSKFSRRYRAYANINDTNTIEKNNLWMCTIF